MRYLAIIIGLGLLGYMGYDQFKPAPESAAPPPPPAVPKILEEPPPMVLDDRALERVRTATRDTDPTVRWEAVRFLIGAQDEQADEMVFRMLHQDSDPQIRRKLIGLLAKQTGPEVVDHISRRLRDTDSNVRLAAVNALAQIGDPHAAEAMGELLHDSDESVRLRAIQALNELAAKQQARAKEARAKHELAMRAWEEKVKQQKAAQGKK